MRSINYTILLLFLFFYSGVSSAASTDVQYFYTKYINGSGAQYSSGWGACVAEYPASSPWTAGGRELSDGSWMCQHGCVTGACDIGHLVYKHLNPDYIAPNPCTSLSGNATGWKKEWASYDAYNNDLSKPKCTTSQNGCAVDICGDNGSMQCGQNGSTGAYACFGNGSYTGGQQDASQGGDVDGCEGEVCQPPPPVTSEQTQTCTPNNAGSFTCTSTSGSSQYAPSQCTVGSTGGQTGWVCVKPDYVPEASTNTRDDVVTSTDNGDGTTTTNTTSTTNNTHCKAGECTTTTTTTTTSTTKDAEGNTLNETKDCTGPNCDKPVDETGEGEDEEGAKFGGSGGCVDGNCAVDAFNPFGQDVIPGFGETTQNIYNGIGNSPIVQAAIGIEFPTGGSCSSYSLSLFDTTITSDHHCQAWSQFSGSLSSIFLAIWAFAAVRVFLSA